MKERYLEEFLAKATVYEKLKKIYWLKNPHLIILNQFQQILSY